MATVINKDSRRRVGLQDARMEPNETAKVDMTAEEVKQHPFYLSGLIGLVGQVGKPSEADDGQESQALKEQVEALGVEFKKDSIMAELDRKGVDYDPREKRDELAKKLVG